MILGGKLLLQYDIVATRCLKSHSSGFACRTRLVARCSRRVRDAIYYAGLNMHVSGDGAFEDVVFVTVPFLGECHLELIAAGLSA